MPSEREEMIIYLTKRIQEILQSELLGFSSSEIMEIIELLDRVKRDPSYIVPLFKRIYEIIKKRPPDERRRRRYEE